MTDYFSVIAQGIGNLTDRIRSLEAAQAAAASYTSLLSNGGFEKWTGGAGPFTANGACADNWDILLGAGSSIIVTKNSINRDDRASAFCAAVSYIHALESYIQQAEGGPFIGTPLALSARIWCDTPNAIRLNLDGHFSAYHKGLSAYETLVLVAVPSISPFDVSVEFDASCTAYIDSVMLVQGVSPIDYVYQDDFIP